MRVKFNDPDEFIEELHKQRGKLRPPILRVTNHFKSIGNPPVRAASIVASCVSEGAVILLESYVGELWGPGFSGDAQVHQRLVAIEDRLRAAATTCDLEVRSGIFEP